MSDYLVMENITKRFGKVFANRHVNFRVRKGEVHGLLGEKGAGKSTLMNILMGLYHPSEGAIYLEGRKVYMDTPAKALKLGIVMVHQHFMWVEGMTVFENIILGLNKDPNNLDNEEVYKKGLEDLSEKYALSVDLDSQITDLSAAEHQRVEILKAIYRGVNLLILDELTESLTDKEVGGLFKGIRKLTAAGITVVFISHKVREVTKICDRITILKDGETSGVLDKDGVKSVRSHLLPLY